MMHRKHNMAELVISKLPVCAGIEMVSSDQALCSPRQVRGCYLHNQELYVSDGFLGRDFTWADHHHFLWLDSDAVAWGPKCSAIIGTQAEPREKGTGRDLWGGHALHLIVLHLDARPR